MSDTLRPRRHLLGYGHWWWALPGILVVVFIETGLLFPFLPGDSLLFTGGLLAAKGTLNIWTLAIAVPLVAIAGDQSAYFIGRRVGPALFTKEDSRFFKKHDVTESHEFFWRASCRSRGRSFRSSRVCPKCAIRCSWVSTSSAVSPGAPG